MWRAFGGYQQVYGRLPPATKVKRVRLWLFALAEREAEEAAHQQEENERLKREMDIQRNKVAGMR